MRASFTAPAELNRLKTLSLAVGFIGLAALVFGAYFMDMTQALRSYLLGFMYWAGIPIGCLGILMLQYIIHGNWGVITRRILEAASRTIWVVAFGFVPLLAGAEYLYPWLHADPNDAILAHKAPYLNFTFFGARAIIYFALFSLMAYMLNKWSAEQERTGSFDLLNTMQRFSAPMMVIYALAVSFAGIDWVMSLDPHWFSTIFGLLVFEGWGLAAFAFVIVMMAWLRKREPMNHVYGATHFHDIGKLMLALVMVWAYFNFSQFLIIWSGNIPEETPWYLARMSGGWGAMGLFLIVFHFALPFLLLLSRDLKRNPRWLVIVAVWVLIIRLVDFYYNIGPTASHGGEAHFTLSWMDLAAPIGIGGIWLYFFFNELQKRQLLPVGDPYLEEAIAHGHGH